MTNDSGADSLIDIGIFSLLLVSFWTPFFRYEW